MQQPSSEHGALNPVRSYANAAIKGSDHRHEEFRFSATIHCPCRHLQRRACRCLATCRGGLDCCCGHPACAPTTRKVAGALLLHDGIRSCVVFAHNELPRFFYLYSLTYVLLVTVTLLVGQAEAAARTALGLVLEGAQHALLAGRPQVRASYDCKNSSEENFRMSCWNRAGRWL